MKVGILAEIASLKSGSRAPIELACALAQNKGVSVLFYAYQAQKDKEALLYLKKNKVKVKLINASFSLKGRLKAVFLLWRDLKKEGPDVLSGHATFPFYLAAFLSRIPCLATYYGTQFNILAERKFPDNLTGVEKILEKIINFFIRIKTKLIFSLSTKQVAISQYTAQEAAKLYKRKIGFIYLGTNTLSLPLRKENFTYSSSVTLLMVSRFTPYKGFHHLIKIFSFLKKKYPFIKLILAGSLGSLKYVQYLHKIKGAGIQIKINLSERELVKVYQSSDIYLSLDQYLFFGLPLLEAGRFALPQVVMNYAAAPELVVHHKTGFVAENLKEFINYLERLIKDKNLRKRMGQKAQERVNFFSWEKTSQQYLNNLKKLAK
jgi:glycosyltransferase involved in cell wall biosynthesis